MRWDVWCKSWCKVGLVVYDKYLILLPPENISVMFCIEIRGRWWWRVWPESLQWGLNLLQYDGRLDRPAGHPHRHNLFCDTENSIFSVAPVNHCLAEWDRNPFHEISPPKCGKLLIGAFENAKVLFSKFSCDDNLLMWRIPRVPSTNTLLALSQYS